jgi:PiT family inorganic phosphate transporter
MMEIEHVQKLERAMKKGRLEQVRFGLGLLFVLSVMLYTASLNDGNVSMTMVIAAMVGAYMAMNIGANDVANNVGPAVGSKAMHLGTALVIAAIFEAAGAIIAGGEVVGTIRNGIIDPAMIPDTDAFVRLMLAALMAGALWLNIATATGAPVSTTHSIVGAVLGAGVAAAGMDIVNWGKMGSIAMSWIVSPLMGALVAALFLYIIKRSITYQNDMMSAARRVVPWLVAAMARPSPPICC